MQAELLIEERYRGPPQSGNGGYVAGAVADHLRAPSDDNLHAAAEVTLRAPIPLDTPLSVEPLPSDELRVVLGDTLIAEARYTALELKVPKPPSFDEALAVRDKSAAFIAGINPLIVDGKGFHPICFCCGADVPRGEGLHVFAAPVPEFDGVAAAWRPDTSFANPQGFLPKPLVWAALDCPGQFAYFAKGVRTGLLGRMTARLLKPVSCDQNTVIIGWCIEVERSKHFAGTALFDESGELCAFSRQVWIGRQ